MSSNFSGGPRPKRGRPRRFDEEEALLAIMEVFWRRGFGATTLDDLVAASRASRASLYTTFGDKEMLFTRALDLYAGRFEERARDALRTAPSARSALVRLLHASAERLTDPAAPAGCLRCNSTLELAGTGGEIGRALGDANRRFQAVMQMIVDEAVAAGDLTAEAAADLPIVFTGAVNGMVTLARSGADRTTLCAFIDKILRLWPPPRQDRQGGP